MHRNGPLSLGGGTRHTAHQGWPHSWQCATACSVKCFVQLFTPAHPPRPEFAAVSPPMGPVRSISDS